MKKIFAPNAEALVSNGKKDILAIRSALKICAEPSISYNFVQDQRVKDQLIIDNLRMENVLLDSKLSEYDKYYAFCVNGLYQIENIINYYLYVKYPDINKLEELDLENFDYLDRLEEEARVKRIIGEKLGTNMFSYPVTLQHYVDMFWESGSIVGAGRGSSCSGLNHYLLGITQLDPIEWDLPFWRYLNKERVELGDIDLDLCPSKRPLIIQKIVNL